jgi:hypothetical protein
MTPYLNWKWYFYNLPKHVFHSLWSFHMMTPPFGLVLYPEKKFLENLGEIRVFIINKKYEQKL